MKITTLRVSVVVGSAALSAVSLALSAPTRTLFCIPTAQLLEVATEPCSGAVAQVAEGSGYICCQHVRCVCAIAFAVKHGMKALFNGYGKTLQACSVLQASWMGIFCQLPRPVLKNAYKKMCLKYHPDKNSQASENEKAQAAKTFCDLKPAVRILQDPADKIFESEMSGACEEFEDTLTRESKARKLAFLGKFVVYTIVLSSSFILVFRYSTDFSMYPLLTKTTAAVVMVVSKHSIHPVNHFPDKIFLHAILWSCYHPALNHFFDTWLCSVMAFTSL